MIADGVMFEQGTRMGVCAGGPLSQIDRSMLEIDRLDCGELRRLFVARLKHLVKVIEVAVLRRELVAIHHATPFRRCQTILEAKSRNARGLLEEFVLRHLIESKE